MRGTVLLCCIIIFMSCSPGVKMYRVNRTGTGIHMEQMSGGSDKWKNAELLSEFRYPWEEDIPEPTIFYALHDDSTFYCTFLVKDSTLVLSDSIKEEMDITKEDRVEIYFSNDREMKEYFCVEVDPLGRILDYHASYYRKFDNSWSMEGIRGQGEYTKDGYLVELSIPLKWLPCHKHGQSVSFYTGLYRADIKSEKGSEITEHWISWINPETDQPDFHVSKSLGLFKFRK